MASQGSKPGRTLEGEQECSCRQLRPGCAGWYQARSCCVADYTAGWVLLRRGAPAAAVLRQPDGGCPRFADQSAQAIGAVAARTSRRGSPPSWLSSGGRPV